MSILVVVLSLVVLLLLPAQRLLKLGLAPQNILRMLLLQTVHLLLLIGSVLRSPGDLPLQFIA